MSLAFKSPFFKLGLSVFKMVLLLITSPEVVSYLTSLTDGLFEPVSTDSVDLHGVIAGVRKAPETILLSSLLLISLKVSV
jgi:hypothetical protein